MQKILIIFIFLFISAAAFTQETDIKIDSTKTINDTIIKPNNVRDTVLVDSSKVQAQSSDAIKSPIKYEAADSMMLSMKSEMVYLYGTGKIENESMILKSNEIEIDMDKNTLYAEGTLDTATNEVVGKPEFQDGKEVFTAETMKYNFKTKKGLVKGVITEQSEGYLHGETTKMHPNKEIHIKGGKFTTCDDPHPHFYLELTKAKVIPDDKIISGPVYFVLLDIPIYMLGLPFGFFPNQKTNRSGILMPQYGEENRRGFYIRDGGYYWAINDNIDAAFVGEIYSYGSWGGKIRSNFKKRYKYSGSLDFHYTHNVFGEEVFENYDESNSFRLNLSYNQDAKANPTSNFSANISYNRNNHNQFNAKRVEDFVQATTTSSVSYRKTFPGTPFNFSANMNMTQNMSDSTTSVKFPVFALNMNRIFPFKRKKQAGTPKWYEKIGVTFNSNFSNEVNNIPDSLLFTEKVLDEMRYGFKYSVPISTSFNLLKYINVSPSINYNARIYPNFIDKYYETDAEGNAINEVDTINQFNHNFDFSASVPLSTKIYGIVEFNAKRLKAIRHVVSPSIGFSYRPDFGTPYWGYYRDLINPNTQDTTQYSIYSNGIYGYPPMGEQQSLTFSLGNNFEMKWKSKKDTTDEFTKVKILERLNFSGSYNFAADSMQLSPINISGGTRFLNLITLNFGGTLDPYALDSLGVKTKEYMWNVHGYNKLARFTRGNATAGIRIDSKTFNKDKNNKKEDTETVGDYDYYDVPWSLTANYSFNYSKTGLEDFKITQTLNFNGNFTLTPNWRVNFSSGYDFKAGKLTSTRIGIFRDLHCWEMSFSVIPFGRLRSYNFRINIKSSLFKGIEYQKDKSWHDNVDY